nr:hypothetical protein [Tanacetum cinerariifolium]
MLMTLDPDIQKNLEQLGAYDMLKELKILYVQQADQKLLQIVREFHVCKHKEGHSVSSYVLKMKIYIDNMERLSHATTQNLSVSLILVSPRKEYDGFVQNYNMHSIGKTKNQKKKSQKAAKGNQRKGKAKMGYAPVQAPPFSPKPKNPSTPKKDNLAKDGLRRSRKLKPGALSLYVGDGHHAAVEAIGENHLCLSSGLVLILHNCHYAPSIIRGIILVSRLYKDGFVNHFENDNSISIFKNNMIYFNSIPHDDIYEIVMSSSNANDSSVYAVSNKRAKLNLDSALLWHCRLEHINKKRIKKFQHDGLLDSTDLKFFENYVACTMARKPYSHQVEKAKDLVGLIHTDERGIIAHRTPPYTPQINEVLERRNQTLLDMVRSMMSQTTHPSPIGIMPLSLLHAFSIWFQLRNEVWHGQAPKLSYLKVWGCETLVKRDTLTKPDKLESKSIKCIFVGYPKETMGYYFYCPPENKVFVARNVEFFENNTSLDHKEDDQEINEPQSDINPIRRSTRKRHAPDRMCLYIDAEEHELRDLGEPANYKAALLDPESDKWLNAMNVEICFAMKDLGEAAYILGIKIYQDRSRRLISLCQSAYIEKILKRFYMENSRRGMIPMQEKLKFSKSRGASTPAEVRRMQNIPYASIVGSIMYAVRCTRPDVAFTLIITSRFQHESRGAVDWKSTKQSIFATSSTDAEYIAAFDASKE